MKKLKTQSEWISVEDRLPPRDEMIIDCSDQALMFAESDKLYPQYYTGYYNFKTRCWGSNEKICDKITHWMPLPLPPKKVT